MQHLGAHDVVEEPGIPHEGVGEKLAGREKLEQDLQAHGLGEHQPEVSRGIGDGMQEPFPVVERHVRVRRASQSVHGQDREPGKSGPAVAVPGKLAQVQVRPVDVREAGFLHEVPYLLGHPVVVPRSAPVGVGHFLPGPAGELGQGEDPAFHAVVLPHDAPLLVLLHHEDEAGARQQGAVHQP